MVRLFARTGNSLGRICPRMTNHSPRLFCFAVKEEAAPFRDRLPGCPDSSLLITGMGAGNARRSILRELDSLQPGLIITSGFAGGLNPRVPPLSVVFEADPGMESLVEILQANGALPARFHCGPKVLATAEAKQAAFRETGADAVEMESGVIRQICRERGIPCLTVRVISDAADEPLPLDFGAIMTPDDRMDFFKLAGTLVRQPGKVGELMRFRKRIIAAAERLAKALEPLVQ